MLRVLDMEQGSPEWFAARAGVPTASCFSDVLAKGEGKTRRKYLLTLAGERLTGEPAESYSNAHMERGKVMEEEARDLYAFQTDAEIQRVGFLLDEALRAGASPDGLIGEDGMVEIKTKLPHLQLEALIAGKLPAEHRAQVQGALWVSGRDWCDFVSYWPRLPLFRIRVERDEAYIATLADAVMQFNDELDALVAKFSTRAA